LSETRGTTETLTVAEAEQLLYREARLLDEWRFEEWLELFTEDGLYWLPVHEDGDREAATSTVSVIYDDTKRREERVFRTLHTAVLDQNPRSRTVHVVSNVEVDPEPVNGDVRVWCSQMVSEMRPGGRGQVGLNDQRTFAGRCEYRLRRVDGEWKFSLKKLTLINSDQPIFNLTFII
jgi:3-phenylpropionate/cinnamic acid dioxygenase small subunit